MFQTTLHRILLDTAFYPTTILLGTTPQRTTIRNLSPPHVSERTLLYTSAIFDPGVPASRAFVCYIGLCAQMNRSGGDLMFANPRKKQRSSAAAAAKARVRSQSDRRCFDTKVDRVIEEHFGDFPTSVVERHLVQGVTLRQAISQILWPDETDRVQRISPEKVAACRLQYACGSIAEAVLEESPSDGAAANKRLSEACESATHKQTLKRCRAPLLALLPSIKNVNKKEAKMILRTVCCLRPSAAPEICSFIMAVTRFMVRVQVDQKWPELLRCLRRIWNDALVAQWNHEQKTLMNAIEFFETYGALMHLCSDKKADSSKTLHYARGIVMIYHSTCTTSRCKGNIPTTTHRTLTPIEYS